MVVAYAQVSREVEKPLDKVNSHSPLGKQLGEASLWLTVSNSLATLNVTPKIGSDGKPIVPTVSYGTGAVV